MSWRPASQPVHRGVDLVGGRPRHVEIQTEGAISPPRQGGQLGCRANHPRDDQRQHQIPRPARRAQQRGKPQPMRHRRHRGHMPVRQRPGLGELAAGRDQRLPLQARFDRGDGGRRQHRQVGHRLIAHLVPVAKGAAQIHRLVVALSALLIHMGLLDSDYVDLSGATRHTKHRTGTAATVIDKTRQYSDYTDRQIDTQTLRSHPDSASEPIATSD